MTVKVTKSDGPPLNITFLGEPFGSKVFTDPCFFDRRLFDDGQYRLLIHLSTGGGHKELHKSADLVTWTVVSEDWMPDVPTSGLYTFQDYVVLGDGTIAMYQNDGGNKKTAVWTGTPADLDAGTMTRAGQVLSTDGDCGAFYDAANDLVHIYTEHPDYPVGDVSSSRIRHWTTPGNDLLNATLVGDAVITDGWGTGDPDIFEFQGSYWMVCDNANPAHPSYWLALLRSDDLTEWELIDNSWSKSTGIRGGDFEGLVIGGRVVGFTEFTGANTSGVGMWEIRPTGTGTADLMIDGKRAIVRVAA